MKKFAYLLLVPSLFWSCSSELEEPAMTPADNTNIEISIPMPDDMKTRGFSDGSSINNLKCYVYGQSKGEDADPLFIEDIILKNYPDRLGSYYSLYLPKGQAYDLVFFATCGAHDNPSGKLYYDKNARTVTVDYNSVVPNDETIDCFFGSIPDVSPDNGNSYAVTLKRPYAQLNIGTKDISDYNDMSSSPLKSVAVSVEGISSSFSAMDGSLKGGVSKLNFAQAERPSGQAFPVSGNDFLSMNYLLVNEQKKVNVSMTVHNQSSSFNCEFSQIPLQRNCRTNIYGNLLTKSNDYKVEITNAFGGGEDTEVDKYYGYDLVLKMVNNYQSLSDKSVWLNCYDYNPVSRKTIDLTPYIDSTNTLKANWEDLGVTHADQIQFVGKQSIRSVIKLDFNKIGVSNFNRLFYDCQKLQEIKDIKNWDTSNIVSMAGMFNLCVSLTSLDVSNFDTSKVTNFSYMFASCGIKSLDVSNFETGAATDMSHMFQLCGGLPYLDLSNFKTSKVTDFSYMFDTCHNLNSVDVSKFETGSATDMSYMFRTCANLSSLDVSSFKTSKVTDFTCMFDGCSSLSFIDVSKFDTGSATTMFGMFRQCSRLSALDLSNFNTSKVTDFTNMFLDCDALASLDIRSFSFANSETVYNFLSSKNLTALYWNVNFSKAQKVHSYGDSFLLSCPKLSNIYGSFNNFKITDPYVSLAVVNFDGCTNLSYDSFAMILNGLAANPQIAQLSVTYSQFNNWYLNMGLNLRSKNWHVVHP